MDKDELEEPIKMRTLQEYVREGEGVYELKKKGWRLSIDDKEIGGIEYRIATFYRYVIENIWKPRKQVLFKKNKSSYWLKQITDRELIKSPMIN